MAKHLRTLVAAEPTNALPVPPEMFPATKPSATDGTLAAVGAAIESDRRLRRVHAYVRLQQAAPVRIDVIAHIAGLPADEFPEYFRQATGMEFQDWLLRWRVARALHLIESATRTLTDAGYGEGLLDVDSFLRSFERSRSAP